MTVYRIAKWNETFENSESRKYKRLTWVALPTGFDSTGYQSMLDEFGSDAASVYGAWCVLVAFAASCRVRGVLMNSKGNPIKLSHVARVTGFSVELLEKLVAWASGADIGWLECVSADECSRVLQRIRENPNDFNDSGKPPDDLRRISGEPPGTPGENQAYVESNRIESNRKELPRIIVDRSIDATTKDLDFFRRVEAMAYKISRLPYKLDREFVWQVAWVAIEIDPNCLDEPMRRLQDRTVDKPKNYLSSVMLKTCEKHLVDWDRLKKQVPAAPPPPKPERMEACS